MKTPSLILCVVIAAAAPALATTENFDAMSEGAPAGWTVEKTGSGVSRWTVEKDDTAPSRDKVLKQSGEATYPICILDGASIKNGFVEVKFKAVGGKTDQAGGVIWRCQDADNYYVARANALEDNVTIYHTTGGRRVAFKNMGVKVAPGVWHTLRVEFEADRFVVIFDGQRVIEARDGHFVAAGKIGVWTKADSVTLFDDFNYGEKK